MDLELAGPDLQGRPRSEAVLRAHIVSLFPALRRPADLLLVLLLRLLARDLRLDALDGVAGRIDRGDLDPDLLAQIALSVLAELHLHGSGLTGGDRRRARAEHLLVALLLLALLLLGGVGRALVLLLLAFLRLLADQPDLDLAGAATRGRIDRDAHALALPLQLARAERGADVVGGGVLLGDFLSARQRKRRGRLDSAPAGSWAFQCGKPERQVGDRDLTLAVRGAAVAADQVAVRVARKQFELRHMPSGEQVARRVQLEHLSGGTDLRAHELAI